MWLLLKKKARLNSLFMLANVSNYVRLSGLWNMQIKSLFQHILIVLNNIRIQPMFLRTNLFFFIWKSCKHVNHIQKNVSDKLWMDFFTIVLVQKFLKERRNYDIQFILQMICRKYFFITGENWDTFKVLWIHVIQIQPK